MTRIVPVGAIVIAFLVPGRLSGELVMPDRPHQPGQDLFKSALPEDLAWKPFPAFPPQVRLAVIVGQPSEAGP